MLIQRGEVLTVWLTGELATSVRPGLDVGVALPIDRLSVLGELNRMSGKCLPDGQGPG